MKSSQWGCDCYSSHSPLSILLHSCRKTVLQLAALCQCQLWGPHTTKRDGGCHLFPHRGLLWKLPLMFLFKGVTLHKCLPCPLGTVHEMRCLTAVENSFYRCHHTSAAWKCRSGESAKEVSCVFFLWVNVCQSTVNVCPQWRNFHMIIWHQGQQTILVMFMGSKVQLRVGCWKNGCWTKLVIARILGNVTPDIKKWDHNVIGYWPFHVLQQWLATVHAPYFFFNKKKPTINLVSKIWNVNSLDHCD